MGCRKEIIEMIEKIENARWLRTIYVFIKILYPIFDYPHEHYTFKHFEV